MGASKPNNNQRKPPNQTSYKTLAATYRQHTQQECATYTSTLLPHLSAVEGLPREFLDRLVSDLLPLGLEVRLQVLRIGDSRSDKIGE